LSFLAHLWECGTEFKKWVSTSIMKRKYMAFSLKKINIWKRTCFKVSLTFTVLFNKTVSVKESKIKTTDAYYTVAMRLFLWAFFHRRKPPLFWIFQGKTLQKSCLLSSSKSWMNKTVVIKGFGYRCPCAYWRKMCSYF